MKRDALERAAYLALKMKDYFTACNFQQQLCDMNESLYSCLVPTVAIHRYTLGKLLSQTGSIVKAVAELTRAYDMLSLLYGSKYEGNALC